NSNTSAHYLALRQYTLTASGPIRIQELPLELPNPSEVPVQSLELERRATAALEYAYKMRSLLQPPATGRRCHRTYGHWKRLFERELLDARKQERLRMAHSQDWSGLGKYVEESFLIARHRLVLLTIPLLIHLRYPDVRKLFEASITCIMQM